MARLRRPERVDPGGVPAELTSRLHPVWSHPGAVEDLAAQLGVRCRVDQGLDAGAAANRFDAFRRAWCENNQLMHPKWPANIDFARARDAGVDMSGSSRFRLARPVG